MTSEHRLGVMGGTFDPIHFGHLAIAEEARYRLNLEKVIFIPCGVPPHKKLYEISASQHRYEMTRLAISDNRHFDISSMEQERSGLSYSVDTITELRQEYPGTHFYFITGADAILEILTWKNPERLSEICTLVAVTRPGYDLAEFQQRIGEEIFNRVTFLKAPGVDVSSSEIRQRCGVGAPIRYLVPDKVCHYIHEHQLYGSGVK